MTELAQTPRTALHRRRDRGAFDRAVIDAILDEALVCHLGFVDAGQPFVLPTTFVRIGDRVYLHGAAQSRLLGVLSGGASVCLTVTLLDGLVLARSAERHSMNYRSVVLLGRTAPVTDDAEKLEVLAALVDRFGAGRSRAVRPPSPAELAATRVAALPVTEGSAKIRRGPPVDYPADLSWPCWAGVVPVRLVREPPVPDEHVIAGVTPP